MDAFCFFVGVWRNTWNDVQKRCGDVPSHSELRAFWTLRLLSGDSVHWFLKVSSKERSFLSLVEDLTRAGHVCTRRWCWRKSHRTSCLTIRTFRRHWELRSVKQVKLQLRYAPTQILISISTMTFNVSFIQVFSKEYINLLLTVYFFFLGVLALAHILRYIWHVALVSIGSFGKTKAPTLLFHVNALRHLKPQRMWQLILPQPNRECLGTSRIPQHAVPSDFHSRKRGQKGRCVIKQEAASWHWSGNKFSWSAFTSVVARLNFWTESCTTSELQKCWSTSSTEKICSV